MNDIEMKCYKEYWLYLSLNVQQKQKFHENKSTIDHFTNKARGYIFIMNKHWLTMPICDVNGYSHKVRFMSPLIF